MIEPTSFEQGDPQEIRVGWKDGRVTTFKARPLRLACPCASCIDELTGRPLLDPETVPAEVAITDTELVGRYAFRFQFSDKHNTGIYTFDFLRGMGEPDPA